MDHSESIRLMAAEKYLLGELTPELQEQFEAHFFECPECALDVRAGAALVEHSKVVLSEPLIVPRTEVPVPATRFGWLRPALVVPVMAALLDHVMLYGGIPPDTFTIAEPSLLLIQLSLLAFR